MTTPQNPLLAAGQAYLRRWDAWLKDNPHHDKTAVALAMAKGELPPEPPPQAFSTRSDDFQNSPLALVYDAVANELRERDPAKKKRPFHHRVALWAAWESHKVAPGTEVVAGEYLAKLGLPKTQKEMAALLGVSPRALRQYAQDYGEFINTAKAMGVQRILAQYDLGVLHAMGQVATLPIPQATSERRLFWQMREMLPADKNDVTSDGKEIKGIQIVYADPDTA